MIWLTWRQFRVQAWVAGAALAVFAIALAASGPHLSSLYGSNGLTTCHGSGPCGTAATSFLQQVRHDPLYSALYNACFGLLAAVPALIGVFWGAPLITREIEAGTFRLAWNQSITRTRWLAAKLGLTGLAALAAAGLLSLMVTWWSSPIQAAAPLLPRDANGFSVVLSRFQPLLFATRGITPLGYAVFAFALGAAAGVLIRHTLPAMAVTLAVFAAIQVAMPMWVRPHFISPVTATSRLDTANITGVEFNGPHITVYPGIDLPGAGAWILSSQAVTASGQPFTGPRPKACGAGSFQACQAALGRLNLRQQVVYQPASRYWDFQWIETGIFLALALALAGLCFWWVQRRRLT